MKARKFPPIALVMQEDTDNTKGEGRTPSGLNVLLIVIAAAVLYSVVQRLMLDFRAGHMDEYDYLFVGKSLLSGLEWPTYTYIFGADFNWYLFGTAEQWFGGLTGARIAAAILGLISLAGVYMLAMALWGSWKVAITATLLMGVHSGHIFASKIATYDSVSFALFALALAPLVYGANVNKNNLKTTHQLALLVVGSVLILLAGLAKYTTVAYLPLVAVALLLFSFKASLIFCVVAGIGLAIHFSLHWTDLRVLYDVQISGIHEANATYKEIISRTLNNTWLLLLPSLLALVHAKSNISESGKRPFLIIGGLLIFSLPLFFYHLQGRNLISLYKHLNYTNLFLSLSAAWVMVLIANAQPWKTSRIFHYRMPFLAVCMALYLLVNVNSLRDIQRGYPDVTALLQHIETEEITGPVLSEDPYLFRYLKFGEMVQEDIKETTWLDNDFDGNYTAQDVKDAIWDRKFEYVLLTDAIHPDDNAVLRDIMGQRGYTLEFNDEYALSPVMTTNTNGQISLYKLTQPIASVEE